MLSYSYASTACYSCHPVGAVEDYLEHDGSFFPVYSGTHSGQWSDCSDCHTDPTDKSVFSCLGCHEQATIDGIHLGMLSYSYESSTCFSCHPSGVVDDYLEHDGAFFPVYSGTHAGQWADCSDCHTDPTDKSVFSCLGCHEQGTIDGIHLGMLSYSYESSACMTCHPSGVVEDYLEHDGAFFPIYSGTHVGQWADCSNCHTDPTDKSVYDCLGCHVQAPVDIIHQGMLSYDYQNSACMTCHPSGVVEEYLEHDGAFFPIYAGPHSGTWVDCATCHTDPTDRTVFNCIVCHDQTDMDNMHVSITGYVYNSTDCITCHPTGEAIEFAEHDPLYFPIYSGSHNGAWSECATCHTVPGDRTIYDCLSCHDQTTIDGIHLGMLSYSYTSTDCYSCHPAGAVEDYLEHDGVFFPIYSGTHSGTWGDCSNCHTDPTDKSVFSCLGCHDQATIDGVHLGMLSYSYESSTCFSCHPSGVVEDYLEHDGAFFPVYSGTHAGQWADCSNCHTDPTDKSVFDCLGCHVQATIDVIHQGMLSYDYQSSACFTCHPSGVVEDYLEHDGAFFPIYAGPHSGTWVDCSNCHTDPADRSVFSCVVCHDQTDTDNMHTGITGYVYNSTDCITCHPTGEAIEFTEHDPLYFPIYSGSHDGAWSECATCHTVVGDRTQFDCLSCHEQSLADIVHMGMPEYSYASDVCYTCHPHGVPEDYPQHDVNGFFPIYSGNHNGVWATCATCHTDPNNRAVFTCLVCHTQGVVDPVHLGMPEYSYESNVCYTCHPNGNIEDYLAHDTYFFPIYSGTHDGRWASCATCHTDPTDKSVFSCLGGCHPRTSTDNKHTNPVPVPEYVYDSYECYNCHPNGVAAITPGDTDEIKVYIHIDIGSGNDSCRFNAGCPKMQAAVRDIYLHRKCLPRWRLVSRI